VYNIRILYIKKKKK